MSFLGGDVVRGTPPRISTCAEPRGDGSDHPRLVVRASHPLNPPYTHLREMFLISVRVSQRVTREQSSKKAGGSWVSSGEEAGFRLGPVASSLFSIVSVCVCVCVYLLVARFNSSARNRSTLRRRFSQGVGMDCGTRASCSSLTYRVHRSLVCGYVLL